jgi:hypothetical protein
MPTFAIQYDVSATYITENHLSASAVYGAINRRLERWGWIKYQYSCWSQPNITSADARDDADDLADEIEEMYGDRIFIRLDCQRHTQPYRVR